MKRRVTTTTISGAIRKGPKSTEVELAVASASAKTKVAERVVALDLKLEIELKHEESRVYEASRAVAELIARHGLHDRAFVSSFDPRFVYYVRDVDPRIVTALGLMAEDGVPGPVWRAGNL